jgi:hypothetical protein
MKNKNNYEEILKEYSEKINISSKFSTEVTLSCKEHKMLLEGYASLKLSKEYFELERADLEDYMLLERSYGGSFS